jgi:2-(1,2-epoxy-1,2-dihydrophenyl)acetyl-CoA isomerase
MTETVLIDRGDGIVTVTFNRPAKKNAADPVMWRELRDIFRAIAGNHTDRVLILTGAGGDFCSGADLTSMPDHRYDLNWMRFVSEVASSLHKLPKPTIAKVEGLAVGGGANLAFGCDLVVASEDARFCEIFSRRGLSLDLGGSWLLPRLVGLHKAMELAYFGDNLSAHEALALGLVNRVLPREELDTFVAQWAAQLANSPSIALSMTKRMLQASHLRSMDDALEAEAVAQSVNFGTEDTAEGLLSFIERREPHFKGC